MPKLNAVRQLVIDIFNKCEKIFFIKYQNNVFLVRYLKEIQKCTYVCVYL